MMPPWLRTGHLMVNQLLTVSEGVLQVNTGTMYHVLIISYYYIIITPQQLGPRSRSQERMF